MKISIVTIVFNDKNNICKTIDSVALQTAQKEMEYIVVDGASTDGTSELIKQNMNHIDTYVCEKDKGIYDAMNKGLNRAMGDYVLFMNSGDKFTSNRVVEEVIQAISMAKETPYLVYGDYREVNNGFCSNTIPARYPQKIWYGPVCSHQSCFYNIEFLKRHRISYDTTYKIAADYKLTLEVIRCSKGNVLKLPLCISDFDISGVSNANQNLGLNEANRARKEVLGWGMMKCGLLKLVLLMARYVKRYFRPFYNILRSL